jgi:hypothetical protein
MLAGQDKISKNNTYTEWEYSSTIWMEEITTRGGCYNTNLMHIIITNIVGELAKFCT